MKLLVDCKCKDCRTASPSGMGVRHVVTAPREYLERLLALSDGRAVYLFSTIGDGLAAGLALGRKANGRVQLLAH